MIDFMLVRDEVMLDVYNWDVLICDGMWLLVFGIFYF